MPPDDVGNYSRDRYRARFHESSRTSRSLRQEAHVGQFDHGVRHADAGHERVAVQGSSSRFSAASSHSRTAPPGRSVHQDPSRLQARSRHHDAYMSGTTSYSLSSGNAAAFQKRGSKRFPIVIALVLVALAVGAWLVLFPPIANVTVNGVAVSVPANATLQSLVDDGHAAPAPGDLIAVDGSVAERGGGNALSATINGDATDDPHARVVRDAVITIDDGADVTEEYEETTSRLPFSASSMQATLDAYYKGSVHLYSTGVDGTQAVRTGKVSGKSVTTVIEQPVNSGFTAYTPDTGGDKVIALTFDDGPWPESSRQILDILNENDAHATFFVIGNQCKDNATVLRQIADAGNQVATHSYDHAEGSGQGVNMTLMPANEQIAEITKGFDAIEDVLGYQVSRVMRAPGGNYYGPMVETLSSQVKAEIGWDVDTLDWSRPGVDAIVQRILSVQPGQIVLMHDGGGERNQTVEALRIALPQLREQGYRFVIVDELLEYGVAGN